MADEAVAACAARFALRSPRRPRGGASGERLGSALGVSLEFHDYRAYEPGDDLRHLDWSVYARTDDLRVRLHREEISPTIEVVVDVSASMAATPAKELRVREILSLLVRLAQRDRYVPCVTLLGPRTRRISRDLERELARVQFVGHGGGAADPLPPLAPRSVRVFVSDLLTAESPRSWVRKLSRDASFLGLIQVLDDEESVPTFEGGHRLIDVESGESLDLLVDESVRTLYCERLKRLQEAWRQEVRGAPGALATVTSGPSLEVVARDVLCPAGILTVRGVEAPLL